MKATVWIVVIDGECGTKLSAHASKKSAIEYLGKYVSQGRSVWDVPKFKYNNIRELIRSYFDGSDEWYVMQRCTIKQ